jgi:hypothetical protein
LATSAFERRRSNTVSPVRLVGAVGGVLRDLPHRPAPANQSAASHQLDRWGGRAGAPSASLSSPDITFQTAVGTVPLVVSASNVPVGTTVTIRVTPAIGQPDHGRHRAAQRAGRQPDCPANVILPPGAGVVTATAAFAVLQALNGVRFDGELAQRMEVITQPDGTVEDVRHRPFRRALRDRGPSVAGTHVSASRAGKGGLKTALYTRPTWRRVPQRVTR